MANNNNETYEIKCLSIAQINIRSIVSHAKRKEFRVFLKKYKPHIVLLSETHLKSKHKVSFEGYKFYRCDIPYLCGTAICVIKTIKSTQLKLPESINSTEICSVKIETINSQIIFNAVYRRPRININVIIYL